jgi:Dicarboxylate transport
MPSFFTYLTIPSGKGRRLAIGGGLFATLLLAGFFARGPLVRMGARALLGLVGAAEIRLEVTHASPWRVVLENVDFRVRTQAYAAGRVVIERAHWWMPSLGVVRLERVRVAVNIDGSDTNPWTWSTYQNGTVTVQPVNLPVEEISLDGQLLLQASALPEHALTVKLAAQRAGRKGWAGRLQAGGSGLEVRAEGSLDPATLELKFKLTEFSLDVEPWQDFLQRLVVLPGGTAELAGQVTGQAGGRLAGKKLLLGGALRLREGRFKNKARAVSAEGVEFDLELMELDKFQSKPGTLRVRELSTGRLVMREVDAGFAFENAGKIAVSRATLKTLGGRVSVEPFKYFLSQRGQLDLVVLVDGLNLEEVLALTSNLPAKATGRVDGRLPLHLEEGGVRLGTGWLALTPGVATEIQFTAPGLLTDGMAANTPSYAVLKKIESGLLRLNVSELRLEIRPPDAPPGRSAQLHLAGEPADPGVKAPVTLDLNVNGPVEKLINLGLDSRVSFGAKP